MRVWSLVLFSVSLACACGRPAPASRAPAPIALRADAAVATPPPIDARRTRFAVGDTVSIAGHNRIYDATQAIGTSDCLRWPDDRRDAAPPAGDPPEDFDLGTVVAVTTSCPGGEVELVDVDGTLAPIYADALEAAPAACHDAIVAMRRVVFPRWDACRARIPRRYRIDGPADVLVGFDAAGATTGVAWQGTTAWGEKAATCMIDAAQRAHLDGHDCAGRTVRLDKLY